MVLSGEQSGPIDLFVGSNGSGEEQGEIPLPHVATVADPATANDARGIADAKEVAREKTIAPEVSVATFGQACELAADADLQPAPEVLLCHHAIPKTPKFFVLVDAFYVS